MNIITLVALAVALLVLGTEAKPQRGLPGGYHGGHHEEQLPRGCAGCFSESSIEDDPNSALIKSTAIQAVEGVHGCGVNLAEVQNFQSQV